MERKLLRKMGQCLASLYIVLYTSTISAKGVENVKGVAGESVALPCQMSPSDPRDHPTLALWYKEGKRRPVYSYDAREDSALHHSKNDILMQRAQFSLKSFPAKLIINRLEASDAGVYTCRVDFYSSPTHNTVVNLTVIEPPEHMAIYDENNKEIRGEVGPINEGTPLNLACIVTGGHPQPTVHWIPGSYNITRAEITADGYLKLILSIAEVTRAYDEQVYRCVAQNSERTSISKGVKISMNLRPLSVSIRMPQESLIAGVQYSIACNSTGSKPAPEISWSMDSQSFNTFRSASRQKSNNVTTNVLQFVPKEDDHGKLLRCQAHNPQIKGSVVTDTLRLDVSYSPRVQLQLGRTLNASEIKQGDDVYFECSVSANPKPLHVHWYRNGEEIRQNLSSGIIATESSLVLQKVSRKLAGVYTCLATNTQGTAESNPVTLDILHKPECTVDQPTMLAVGKGEKVNITCRVTGNPLRGRFYWQFNDSEKIYSSEGAPSPESRTMSSYYMFAGISERDFGSLFCWANNSIGKQEKYCQFRIILAGPPAPPENCEILNHTAENIEVLCNPGFAGALNQNFLAEVHDEHGALHVNVSSDTPEFSVRDLNPGTAYSIKLSAFNSQGRSKSVSLTAYTLKVAEKRMGKTNSGFLSSPLVLVFVAIVGAFLFTILALFLVARWRKNFVISASGGVPSSKGSPGATAAPSKEEKYQEGVTALPVKPKKKVLVVENGKLQRPGDSDSISSKDSLLPRSAEERPQLNGGLGFYNSAGKTSFAASPIASYLESPTMSLSDVSRPSFSMYQKRLSHNAPESPTMDDQYHFQRYPSPRSSSEGYGGDISYGMRSEVKSNPKYVVRTRMRDAEDESFV